MPMPSWNCATGAGSLSSSRHPHRLQGIEVYNGGCELEIVAPYGLAENWSLRVAPNPRIRYPAALFNRRVREKRWLEHWPRLQVCWPSGTGP